nr:uncharacterized protein LOC104100975 [Nicotiana tomentosiformis]
MTDILTIFILDAYVVIDPRSIFSYVTPYFALDFEIKPEQLLEPFFVSTLVGDSVIASHVYKGCRIIVKDRETTTDITKLKMIEIDAIMGMDWLSKCYGRANDCRVKIVKFEFPNEPTRIWKSNILEPRDTNAEVPTLESVPIVNEYLEVFPKKLPGIPPDRVIDFGIDVLPNVQPISIPPYRMLKIFEKWSNQGIRLDESDDGYLVAYVIARSSLIEHVKAKQFEDPNMVNIQNCVQSKNILDFALDDDRVLKINGRLWVPNIDGLRDEIMAEAHNSRYFVHSGCTKIYKDLLDIYWWNKMKESISNFVSRSLNYQQVKVERQRPGGLAQNIEIPLWKWEMINIDFVVGLPRTRLKHDSIWAKFYLKEIVRLHGIPVSIISDRGAQFTAHFWPSFQEGLGTCVNLSTSFHPQTDGQAERTIQTLEDMLRACVIDFGGNWDDICLLLNSLIIIAIRSPVGWFEPTEVGLLGPNLVHNALQKGYKPDPAHMISPEVVEINEGLTYEEEPVEILDRQVRRLRTKDIASVKVL